MKAKALHRWDVTPRQAIVIQERLRSLVIDHDRFGPVRHVAGIDVGIGNAGRTTRAAIAVLSMPERVLIESVVVERPAGFPYLPGLLSFREVPAILEALERLDTLPDLILCDGQGLAHPRRFGLACHLGVLTDKATIGVAKTRLIGAHAEAPAGRGEWTPLYAADEVIGAVLRSRAGVKPLYISIGHRITLGTAVDWVMRCTGRYRLPETTRWAHRLASTERG